MIEVTFWPILAAGVASALIGWIWYHPKVFGTAWMRMSGVTPEMADRGKKRMPLYAFIAFLASMLVAWVMSHLGVALGIYDWVGAVFDLALWLWIGFVVPPMLGVVLWEQKPAKLYLINASYWLVVFVATALILVVGAQASSASYNPAGDTSGTYIAE